MYNKIAKFTAIMVENNFWCFRFKTTHSKITTYKTKKGRNYSETEYVINGFEFLMKRESYIVDFYLMEYLRLEAEKEGLDFNLQFNNDIIFSFSDKKIVNEYFDLTDEREN